MNRSIVVAAIFGLASAILSTTASAATFVVNTTADTQDTNAGDGLCADSGGNCSLRAAITEANALAGPDIITLPAGTYTETLVAASENNNAGGDFDLNSEITINGAGSATTIVQAAATRGIATERVFHLRAAFPMTLTGLTIRYGRYLTAAGTFGAGVRVDIAAVIANFNGVIIEENDDGTSGGGLAISGAVNSVTTLTNCEVRNNTAGGTAAASSTAGGIMLNVATGTLNLTDSVVNGNTVSNTSTTVSASGGGISSVGTLNITNSMVTNNTATSSGSNTFSGGLHITAGTATILGSTISGNASTVTAGAGNGFAGGIYNQQATVNVTNSVVTGNTASSFHGGIRVLSSTLAAVVNITNSTISNNTAVGEGGGLVNFSAGAANSTITISGSTVSGNSASALTSVAGGLENVSTSTGLAAINLTNSTVSGNSAAGAAGSYNSGATATINYDYATIANNTATNSGGGVLQDTAGTTNLKNSIVADNTAATGADISGTVTSQGYNHVEDISGGTFTAIAGDTTGTDPQLGALANNGGTTLTHLPAAASPVVNTIPSGTSECGTTVATSQNGITRPQQTGCEKGSVEVVGILSYTIGGTVSGLLGTGLVLQDNGGDDLSITSDGAFTFVTPVASGSTYTVTVSSDPTGPTQTCSVSNGTGTVGATNVTNVTVTCTPSEFADLAVTKTNGTTTSTPGTNTTYTITASNAGPSAAPGSTIVDYFPSSCSGGTVTWTCVGAGGGSCTATGTGNIYDTVNLPSGASVAYTAICPIAGWATGTLENTATVAVAAGITDPTPGNNSATDTDTLVPGSADLGITKTNGTTTSTPGTNTTYTITASNAGPSAAPGSTVIDYFPSDCSGGTVAWTCAGAGGGSCTASGTGNIYDTVNLPSGGSATYTAICPIAGSATGTLENTATVAVAAGITDPTPGNNSATDTDTLTPTADLGITKTDGTDFVSAGTNTTYTITASNAGPSAASGSTVADFFPAECGGGTWTCVGAGGGSCTGSGTGNIYDTVNLPFGGSATYTAICAVAAWATGTLTNTATVAVAAGITDPTSGNNSATDSDAVVLFRDGFDGVGVLLLDAGNSLTLTVPQTSADSPADRLLVANGAFGSSFRLETMTSDSAPAVRFVEVAADGTETAGDWIPVVFGEKLAVGLVETASHPTIVLAGTSGEHLFTFAGDAPLQFDVHVALTAK